MQMISQIALNNLPSIIGLVITILSIYYGFKYRIQELEKDNQELKDNIKSIQHKLLLFMQTIDKNKIFIKASSKEISKVDSYTRKNIEEIYSRLREIENNSKDNLYKLRRDIYKSIDRKIARKKSN